MFEWMSVLSSPVMYFVWMCDLRVKSLVGVCVGGGCVGVCVCWFFLL